jgi:hypothetical protein
MIVMLNTFSFQHRDHDACYPCPDYNPSRCSFAPTLQTRENAIAMLHKQPNVNAMLINSCCGKTKPSNVTVPHASSASPLPRISTTSRYKRNIIYELVLPNNPENQLATIFPLILGVKLITLSASSSSPSPSPSRSLPFPRLPRLSTLLPGVCSRGLVSACNVC